MPIGPYKDFATCILDQTKKGHDKNSATRICGEIEKRARGETMTKDWHNITFSAPITESIKMNNDDDLIIRGTAINETITRNGVKYTAEELRIAAPSLRSKPILKDHNNSVDSIVGRTTNNINYDEMNSRLPFEARIVDEGIKSKIKKGLITNVSVGAQVRELTEEKMDDGNSVIMARGIDFVELSLVAVPGDPNANINMDFNSAIAEAFEIKKIQEKEEVPKVEEAKEDTPIKEEKVVMEEQKMDENKIKELEEKLAISEALRKEKEITIETMKTEKQNETLKQTQESEARIKKLIEELDQKEKKIAETGTKGKVNNETEVVTQKFEGYTVGRSDGGFAFYRENYDGSNLKRLVR